MGVTLNVFTGQLEFAGSGGGGGGGSAQWKDPVATEATLPLIGNTDGDARVALDTHNIYVWDGAAWVNQSTGTIPPTTATLTDNTTSPTSTASFPVASESVVFMRYSIVRGVIRETGEISLVTDGTSSFITRGSATNNGDPGVTFTADISGGNMRLLYTTTSTGSNASFKFKVESWLG